MEFASAVVELASPPTPAETPGLIETLLADIEEESSIAPDFAALFFTGALGDAAREVAQGVRERLTPRVFVGVSAESVVGNSQEVERRPGVSLLVGKLPNVTLQPFHLRADEWPRLLADEERLQQRIGSGEEHRGQLLLADPFTTPIDDLLSRLDTVLGVPTFGGMASGASGPGGNLLMLNDAVYRDGAVGIGFGGAVHLDTVVSQGCRPIGEPLAITRAEENRILELGRRPALQVAEELLSQLPAEDLALLRAGGLFVGLVINEYQERFGRGDFLIRSLLGADRETKALAIGDAVRAGQTLQFHLRDATSADEELRDLLTEERGRGAVGGLLFSCNGRGTRMFPEPNHDARVTRELLPGLPLAGFFAMGELGPIGGKSFIHGHTASLVLFRPAS
jgi:small ligand-binding sensory domain FIST